MWAVGGLCLAALVLRWVAWFDPDLDYQVWGVLTGVIALFVLAIVVLAMVLRPGNVTRRRIEGAVAAYLLLGLAWAGAYEWVALRDPAAFAGAVGAGGDPWIYYSLVTLTTMGYGDITPVSPMARSLAVARGVHRPALPRDPDLAPRRARARLATGHLGGSAPCTRCSTRSAAIRCSGCWSSCRRCSPPTKLAPTSHTLLFVLSVLAIVPLATLLSHATESVAAKTGDAVGGLLNATLGNLTELVIALAALRAGEYMLVKASLAGAIVTNTLFMLGASFLLGGLKHHVQEYNRVERPAAGRAALPGHDRAAHPLGRHRGRLRSPGAFTARRSASVSRSSSSSPTASACSSR